METRAQPGFEPCTSRTGRTKHILGPPTIIFPPNFRPKCLLALIDYKCPCSSDIICVWCWVPCVFIIAKLLEHVDSVYEDSSWTLREFLTLLHLTDSSPGLGLGRPSVGRRLMLKPCHFTGSPLSSYPNRQLSFPMTQG